MKPPTYITTSWDDGHPLDFRIAELLARHQLQGTFYVPRVAKAGTMTAAQIRELSSSFEVGAHTLNHTILTRATEQQARQEIRASKFWLEDLTGRPCPMFCPPKGKYFGRHLAMIREARYVGVRTVELLSLDFPRPAAGLLLMPTTLQAHPHRLSAFARNLAHRAAFRNLWLYIVCGRSTDWPKLARSLLARAIQGGGVFHLWGHSWELEKASQWQRLEEILKLLSQFINRAPALTNFQVCQAVGARSSAARHTLTGAWPDRRGFGASADGSDVDLATR
jgi:hypothetical protein